MSDSNQRKADHGKERQEAMERRLNALVSSGELKSVETKARKGYDGLDPKQFYAPFEIEFEDGTKWEVFSTTCWKDRYKMYEWDAYHLKRIDSDIECCVLSLSDTDDKTKRAAKEQNEKRQKGTIYSSLDAVYLDEELFTAINERAYEIIGLTKGQISNRKGSQLEQHLIEVLENVKNLCRYLGSETPLVGNDFELFKTILDKIEVDKSAIMRIRATSDIPRLPTKGLPKTDVAVFIDTLDGATHTYTISCKRSKRSKVSVMQFDASDLIASVGIKEPALIDALKKQQECGSTKTLVEKYGQEPVRALTTLLPMYYRKIARWLLGGVFEATDPLQEADWILTRRDYDDGTHKIGFHSVEEYINAMSDYEGQYNTPFAWTYHEKGNKRQIQIKIPLI